jgi:hypothetical protein
MENSLRSLAPRDHDRVQELLKKSGYKLSAVIASQLQVSKILRDPKKYTELLEKIEKQAAKSMGFNFLLKNIPDHGPLRETGEQTKVGYQEMRDTLGQFGTVQNLEIIKGTVYVNMDDPVPCHKTINHMQMGSNILTSNVF